MEMTDTSSVHHFLIQGFIGVYPASGYDSYNNIYEVWQKINKTGITESGLMTLQSSPYDNLYFGVFRRLGTSFNLVQFKQRLTDWFNALITNLNNRIRPRSDAAQ
ncbi:hypothetical protein J6590_027463 [Homalodisca vitripennis]|nr:hypothetical protein J6590_027463 [Homalodisca vitripennis]